MLDQLLGQTIGRYKIIASLGGGGMGSVFRALDLTLQRDVAIKIMHPHIASQGDFRERFLQEARTAARMDHPGIVQVYDFGSAKNLLYLVMKYIPGDNLEKMLRDLRKAGKWVVLNEGLQIIRQVGLALDYAHHQGVLHRDMKPGNVMVEPAPSDGLPYRPVITDLGLAKLAEGGVVTADGTSMGTPAYMSPEQAAGQATDRRSDIYSLGIMLYELATGQVPFPAKSLTDALRYHIKEPPPPPRTIRPDLPEPLEKIILKTLAKNPADRFATAAELAAALEQLPKDDVTRVAQGGNKATPLEKSVSLMTQYQESLLQPRGGSIFEEFAPPTSLGKDQIQVLKAGQTIKSLPLKGSGLTIGREADNDLPLDDAKVSRHHAKIEFDGKDYQVVDLNSSNGTYLANARLLPGVAELWTPDKALRVGDTWLRLLRSGDATVAAGQATYARPAGTSVDMSRVQVSAGDRRVGLYIDNLQATVEPGKNVSLRIVLLNLGGLVDHFTISVNGIPAEWTPGFPRTEQLLPGTQQEITLIIQPPRSPQSRAGLYPVTIRAVSADDASQSAETKVTLTVTSYTQFAAELQPEKMRAGQPGRVTVRNQGNSEETFNLAFKDRADELNFTATQPSLVVPEGKVSSAEFRARPRRLRWIGTEKTHNFTIGVGPAKADPHVITGELVSRALLPPWLIPLLMMICVALAGLAGLLYFQQRQSENAQATAQAMALNGATATFQWMAGDDDKDGLLNQIELEMGTRPDDRDTDRDGLDDGKEVNRKPAPTNPLNDDTDEDGVKDGDEVSRGMDPLSKDTDGDGLPDAQDLAPLATSTPTPNATTTAEQIAQQTATAAAQQTAAAGNSTEQARQTQSAAASQTQMIVDAQNLAAQETQQAAIAGTQTAIAQTEMAAWAMTQTALAAITTTAPPPQPVAMNCYLGNWVPTAPDGGLARVFVEKVDDFTVNVYGYGQCGGGECDWSETVGHPITTPFAEPLVATYDFGWKTTRITLNCAGSNLLAETFDDYSDSDGRTDRTSNYTLERKPFLLITGIHLPVMTAIFAPPVFLPTP